MKLHNLIILLCLVVLTVGCIVPTPAEKDCLTANGKITKIYEGGVKDVCIRLDSSPKMFYINRGLENGLELQDLQSKLQGKEVTIKYPDYLSFFGSNRTTIHLCKLEHENQVIYNELKS